MSRQLQDGHRRQRLALLALLRGDALHAQVCGNTTTTTTTTITTTTTTTTIIATTTAAASSSSTTTTTTNDDNIHNHMYVHDHNNMHYI